MYQREYCGVRRDVLARTEAREALRRKSRQLACGISGCRKNTHQGQSSVVRTGMPSMQKLTKAKKPKKNIQQLVFAGRHRPNY